VAEAEATQSAPRVLSLGMEMFESDVQGVIDEYLAGHIRERDFHTDARCWNNYATDYRPMLEFARSEGK
jgi:uncharacterized iron-regulated protein